MTAEPPSAEDFSARATVPETAGVHAALPWRYTPPRTACGLSVYRLGWYADPYAEVTCYRCRTALTPPVPVDQPEGGAG